MTKAKRAEAGPPAIGSRWQDKDPHCNLARAGEVVEICHETRRARVKWWRLSTRLTWAKWERFGGGRSTDYVEVSGG